MPQVELDTKFHFSSDLYTENWDTIRGENPALLFSESSLLCWVVQMAHHCFPSKECWISSA